MDSGAGEREARKSEPPVPLSITNLPCRRTDPLRQLSPRYIHLPKCLTMSRRAPLARATCAVANRVSSLIRLPGSSACPGIFPLNGKGNLFPRKALVSPF